MFICLLNKITVIKVLLLQCIFVYYSYYPTFRLSDLGSPHIRSNDRGSTVVVYANIPGVKLSIQVRSPIKRQITFLTTLSLYKLGIIF